MIVYIKCDTVVPVLPPTQHHRVVHHSIHPHHHVDPVCDCGHGGGGGGWFPDNPVYYNSGPIVWSYFGGFLQLPEGLSLRYVSIVPPFNNPAIVINPPVNIPEPGTYVLLFLGLVVALVARHIRRKTIRLTI